MNDDVLIFVDELFLGLDEESFKALSAYINSYVVILDEITFEQVYRNYLGDK